MQPNFIDNVPAPVSAWAQWINDQAFWFVPTCAILGFVLGTSFFILSQRRRFHRDFEQVAAWTTSDLLGRLAIDKTAEQELRRVLHNWRVLIESGLAFKAEKALNFQVWVYRAELGFKGAPAPVLDLRAWQIIREGWRPNTQIAGVMLPALRWEYQWKWLTKLLRGQGPVVEVAVKTLPGDRSGARALAHELGKHVYPRLKSEISPTAYRFTHDDPELDLLTQRLLQHLDAEEDL